MGKTHLQGLALVARLSETFRALFRSRAGGIGVGFAVTLPMLMAIVGVASDYALMTKIRGDLQQAADAAAMAGAREIPLAKSDVVLVQNSVRAFAAYRLVEDADASDDDLHSEDYDISVQVNDGLSTVDVAISYAWTPFFAHLIVDGITPIRVNASARFVGRNNICVLGLKSTNTSVLLDKNARLTGNNCGLFTNSPDKSSLKVNTGAMLDASIVCSAGGVDQTNATISPSPTTDCPVTEDPLKSRPPPVVGSCDHTDMDLTSVTQTLNPGVYCGGLTIDGTSEITLNPGVYVMKDGGLNVAGQAILKGTGVGFYVTGAATPTKFSANTHVELSAPESGPLAGLLLFEDRNLGAILKHRITSDDARKLIGTIYLPVGGLIVDAKNPVADQSAYTAIIAQTLELNMGPNLVLNSDYEATNVPVPSGIAGSSQVILSN